MLLLHRALPAEHVVAGIRAALTVGAVSADVVAVEARRHAATAASDAEGWATTGRRLAAHDQRVSGLSA